MKEVFRGSALGVNPKKEGKQSIKKSKQFKKSLRQTMTTQGTRGSSMMDNKF